MQSFYKIIKSTVIEGHNVIATPVINFKAPEKNNAENEENTENSNQEYNIMFLETKAKINDMLAGAEKDAQLLIEKTKLEAIDIQNKAKDEGYQEGYRSGYKDGYDLGIKEADKDGNITRQEAETFLRSSHEEVNSFILKSKNEIIKLSVEIARHILNTELTINSEAIYKITEKAVSKAVDKKQLLIKVNPDDFNYLKNKRDELSIYVEDSNNLFIIADPTIKHTSVKIESSSGFVDASIDTQLGIILKSLAGDGYNAES